MSDCLTKESAREFREDRAKRESSLGRGSTAAPNRKMIVKARKSAPEAIQPREAPPPHDALQELPKLDIFTADSLGDDDPTPRRWHVPSLIPAEEITLLTGDGGTGKSLLALQLAFATATGTDWIGTYPETGRVLVVCAEDDKPELHRRLSTIARRKGHRLSEADNLDLLSLAGRDAVLALPGRDGNLAPTLLFFALRERIKAAQPTLMVLDTLADLFGGDEIKRAHARQFIGLLRGLALDFGVTILLLSHPSLSGMGSGNGTSGSTAWSNSVRSRLYLEKLSKEGKDNDARVLKTMKANYGRVGDERVLRWHEGVFLANSQASSGGLIKEAADDQVFLDCLDVFERTGQNFSPSPSITWAPKVFAESPTAKNLAKERLAKAMGRLLERGAIHIREFGPPSRPRKTLARGSAPIREAEK